MHPLGWCLCLGLSLRQGVDYETDGCCHDLLGNIGFMFAVRQILRIKEGGLGYWALPCNSFSFMAKSLHQRTSGDPFGCNHHGFVVAGTILATRMVALLMLCVCRQVKFFVEQPDRSAAAVFPYLQHLLSFPQVDPQRVFWSGSYLIFLIGFHTVCIWNVICIHQKTCL